MLFLVDNDFSAFSDLSIQWISWLRPLLEGKSIALLIIDFTDPEVANHKIDGGIVTKVYLHPGTFYITDCHLNQCFKFLHYGHKTVKCKQEILCNKCSSQQKISKFLDLISKCAEYQGPHDSFDKNCSKRARKLTKSRLHQLPQNNKKNQGLRVSLQQYVTDSSFLYSQKQLILLHHLNLIQSSATNQMTAKKKHTVRSYTNTSTK